MLSVQSLHMYTHLPCLFAIPTILLTFFTSIILVVQAPSASPTYEVSTPLHQSALPIQSPSASEGCNLRSASKRSRHSVPTHQSASWPRHKPSTHASLFPTPARCLRSQAFHRSVSHPAASVSILPSPLLNEKITVLAFQAVLAKYPQRLAFSPPSIFLHSRYFSSLV